MVVNFGLLGLFELKELILGEEITMVVGAGEDSDRFGDRVIFDTGHGLAAARTDRVGNRDSFSLGKNRIDVFGGVNGDEVGQVRGKKMATAVETFVNVLSLTIGGFDGDERERRATVRTGHEFILAKCLEKVFLFLSCISTKKTRRSPPQRRGRLFFV